MSSLTRFRCSYSSSSSLASSAPSPPRLPIPLPRTSSRPQPPPVPLPQHHTPFIHTTGHRRPPSTSTTSTIAPSLSTNASTAFHRSVASPDLAAAKRAARGRGGRSSSRGRRGRSDPDDHPPSNGATSFVFATPPSNAPTEIDQQRERLLRRLNEISLEKRKLEQTQQRQQTSSSLNGASAAATTVAVGPTTNSNHIHHQNNTTITANVVLSSSTPPLANNNHNPIPPNNSSVPLPASADSPHHHHSYHNNSIHYNDDVDHPRGHQIHQYPHHSHHHHDLSRDDIRKDDVSSEDASKPYHHSSSYKPRASSSGISGISPPPHSSRKQPPPSSSSAPPVVPSAPQKRRRGDLRDPPADSDAPTAGHVDGSESPPRMHLHHDHSNRNGKHAASKTRASSTSVIPTASAHGGAKSASNYPLSSPSPSPPLPPPAPPSSLLAGAGAAQHQHSSAHSLPHLLPQIPQPIDLDPVIGVGAPPLHPTASKDPGDRSRSRQSATAPGRAGSTAAGSLPGSSPQGSPNLLSARGSGRVRTPSVLLSSHPGEKTGGLGGPGGVGSSGHAKNRQVTFCLRLVKDMIRLKDGVAFAKPIDQLWTVEQLPGYFDVIKQPMDLGTIRDRLEGSWYMKTKGKQEVEEVVFDLESFKSDTRLVFTNARTYNRPGDMFYEAATRLMEKFESKMKHVPSASEVTHQASKKSSKKRKKSSSTVSNMVGSVTSSGVGSASDPIVVLDSTTTATGGSGRKNESSKKRKVSKGDTDENGRASRTSKKKPPIPSGVGAGGTGGKSRGSIGGGSSSKKKKGSSGAGSRASGGPGSSGGGPGMARSSSADLEVVEVKPHVNKQDTMSVADMEVRLRALKRQRSLLESGAPASPPAGSSTSYKAQAQALYHVEMTYQEKVQLSTNVGRLPADKLRRIVALATKNKSSSMEVTHNDNEEIELDIDSMNNETLREMEAYVNQILSKGKKKGSGSALTTSPNADLLSMTMDQVNAEIEKLTAVLHKGDAGNGDETDGKKKKSNKSTNSNKGNNSNLNKKSHNSNTHNNSKTKNEPDGISHMDMKDGLNNANSKSQGHSHGGGGSSKNKKTSFYDESSSGSDSDDSGSGSGSGSSDDDSSSDDSDSSDEDDDESDRDGGDEETQRKRRERNLAHQQAMQQAAGTTPLPSPGYQGSQRSC